MSAAKREPRTSSRHGGVELVDSGKLCRIVVDHGRLLWYMMVHDGRLW